jgi:hypothetical protein
MGNQTGILSGKPSGFFPISTPTPRRGVGNGKTEVGNSHCHEAGGNGKAGNEPVAWGVFQPSTGRFDGWYFRRDVADEVLAYLRSLAPGEVLCLVARTNAQPAFTGRLTLRAWNLAPARAFAQGA